jgi:hypothetical protein
MKESFHWFLAVLPEDNRTDGLKHDNDQRAGFSTWDLPCCVHGRADFVMGMNRSTRVLRDSCLPKTG